jgi:hypothetical protein
MRGHRVFAGGKAGGLESTCWLRSTVLVSCVLALSACTVAQLSGDGGGPRNPAPVNYKPEILAMLRVYLNDPTQIREAGISEPMLQAIDSRNRYVVCLRLNAKNSDGQYAGNKEYAAVFLAGRLDQMLAAKPEQCSTAEYQAFPEAQTLTR